MLSEERTADGKDRPDVPLSARETGRVWEPVHCRRCKRLLCKLTRGALHCEQILETKCFSCDTVNYIVGSTDPTPN